MRVRLHIDSPRPPPSVTHGPLDIHGWTVDADLLPATRVEARVGTRTIDCRPEIRPDVVADFARHHARLEDPAIGFRACLSLPVGRHQLHIETHFRNGTATLAERSFTVAPWPPPFPGPFPHLRSAWYRRKWRHAPGPTDSVLALVPVKPGSSDATLDRARALLARTLARLPHRIVFDDRGAAPARGTHLARQAPLAAIRQAMIDTHLRAERWVFWADLDLIDYPADLVSNLIRRAAGGIAAPLVLIAPPPDRPAPLAFFDLAGFVEKGRWASRPPPFFRQRGPVYRLDSVGCCYLISADLYRAGARHEPDPHTAARIASGQPFPPDATLQNPAGQPFAYTEHYSVCAFARRHGRPVQAFADLTAFHESHDLP